MDEILRKVLKRIKPDNSVQKKAGLFLKELNLRIKKLGISAEAVVGGSVAKGTHLKGDFDVDVFVRFSPKYKNLSEILEEILKPYKKDVVHGSRDYFQIKKEGMLFEVVPVLKISKASEAKNVTDMSPLHVEWVLRNSNQKIRDDIRLAKQFCKAQKVYGAESYVKGFSGHVLDILIIYYGGFLELLKNSLGWKQREVIDFYNHFNGKALYMLNSAKISSPLVIIDPIMPERNAAAALSREKYDAFRKAAESFLMKPSEEFFRIKKLDLKEAKATKDFAIILSITPKDDKGDVAGAKVMKALEHIKRSLRKNDFKILKFEWEFGKTAKAYFIIKKENLPEFIIRQGPPLHKKKDVKKFKGKHKRIFYKKNRVYAKLKRKYKNPAQLVRDIIKDDYIKERVKKIKCLR